MWCDNSDRACNSDNYDFYLEDISMGALSFLKAVLNKYFLSSTSSSLHFHHLKTKTTLENDIYFPYYMPPNFCKTLRLRQRIPIIQNNPPVMFCGRTEQNLIRELNCAFA